MTVIVITHNLAIAPMADRVIQIKNGRVSEMTVNPDPRPVETIDGRRASMRNAINKDFFREIKYTLNRYVSILSDCSIGCCFFWQVSGPPARI